MSLELHRRYQGLLSGALVIVLVGVYLGEQWIVVLAGIPLSVLVFASVSSVPEPTLSVEREISPTRSLPPDDVTVRLTVSNDGETNVPDLRLVDGVPETLSVTAGSPTVSAALVPGQSETVSYQVSAARGTHSFAPPTVRARGLSADAYRDSTAAVSGDTELTAQLLIHDPPTVKETATLVGAVTSEAVVYLLEVPED